MLLVLDLVMIIFGINAASGLRCGKCFLVSIKQI